MTKSERREKYNAFCKSVYVPIYSKIWWMDAVCGEENWDVWLCIHNDEVIAAMPYYFETRGKYKYITKALLTQNNGVIFKYPVGAKEIAKRKFEEKVIDQACQFIKEQDIDVYEQQYHYNFTNWLPFFWNYYTEITRYTYVIEDTSDIQKVWECVSSSYRKNIKKGNANGELSELDADEFYEKHENVFLKQGLKCPFSYEQWIRIYNACMDHDAGRTLCMRNSEGNISSILFLMWDEESAYHLLGGSMPEYQKLETYNALTWEGIKIAASKGLRYDFEGSVIKRISKSFREFGGVAKPYFRIRKVFNPEILRNECEQKIEEL